MDLPAPFTLVTKETTESTNTDAACLAEAGAADLTVIWAKEQTAARGQFGRRWYALRGNLFWSAVVHLTPGQRLDGLAMAVSLAVYDTVRACVPASRPVAIKWPNDILVDGHKTSGILIEQSGRGWAIIGVGINVLHAPEPEAVAFPATSITAQGAQQRSTMSSSISPWPSCTVLRTGGRTA